MLTKRSAVVVWLFLVAMTLAGALLGETAATGSTILVLVVVTMAIKGRLVIDYFMEMRTANRTLRRLLHAYFYIVPLVTVVVYLFAEELSRILTL